MSEKSQHEGEFPAGSPAFSRRSFFRRAGLLAGGAALAGATGAGLSHSVGGNTPKAVAAPASATSDTSPSASAADKEFQQFSDRVQSIAVPFNGDHQSGITTPPPPYCTDVALDLQVTRASEVKELLQRFTALGREFAQAGFPSPNGTTAPPADNGVLGAGWQPDAFTLTIGLGDSLFDHRFGFANRKPKGLQAMEPFADDSLVPELTGGDISLQLCANSRDTINHALRMILHDTRGAWALKWKKNGYRNASRPTGTPRNHFGFRDGTVNPDANDTAAMDKYVWTPANGPWAAGGSFQVIRLIEMLTEFWDRITVSEQEGIFGRDRISGAPLTGGDEFTPPNYVNDPKGEVVPLDAHIRLANPRTAETRDQQILRRAYNWDDGIRSNGTLDVGLLFICYQRDLEKQFITIQKCLAGEALADYLRPVGGGYFYCPPGVKNDQDFAGSSLFQ